jgi:hypothetical protein
MLLQSKNIKIYDSLSDADIKILSWTDPSFIPSKMDENSQIFHFEGDEELEPHIALVKICGKKAEIVLSDAGWASFKFGLLNFILAKLKLAQVETLNLYARKLTKSASLNYWKTGTIGLKINGPHSCNSSDFGETFMYSRMKFTFEV